MVLTGFAGAGITHGRTFTDLYDAGNNLYDYSIIDPNRNSKLVYDDLVTLSDGNFETNLISKAAILPTAGFFIGYRLSRSFSLGIEYKTNFYRFTCRPRRYIFSTRPTILTKLYRTPIPYKQQSVM